MATYYFDSISGNDSNTGASWAQAWQGDTKQIATYIASGNIIWLRGSWSNQVGGTFTGLSGFELRVHPDDGALLDCRTRHSSGWSNVSSSKVWKKSFSYQTHRLFLGNGQATGFTEGSDVAKRQLVSTSGSWTTTAASDGQVVTVLDAGSVNQAQFWYWDGVSGTLYVRSTNNSTNPDTAYGGVWTCDGRDTGYADRRRWTPFEFVSCTSLYIGAVEIRGAVRPMRLVNCSGTVSPFVTDFPHYQWETLALYGSSSGSRPTLTVESPQVLMRRPNFTDDIMQSNNGGNFDDGNGQRQQGGADCVVLADRWQSLSIYGGTVQGSVHGAIASQWYHGLDVAGTVLIRGTYIDSRLGRYARGLNLQHASGKTINAITFERITVDAQNISSQVNMSNLTIRDSVFRNGRLGWFSTDGSTPTYIDKYDPTFNSASRWRNSHALDVSRIDGNAIFGGPMTFDNIVFAGQHDAVFAYVHYGSGQNSLDTRVRNCWFIRNPALAGALLGDRVFWNDNEPYSITFENSNKHSGYSTVPSGTTTMSAAEVTLYSARAQVSSFTFAPTAATVTAGGSQAVTVTARNNVGAAVADFAGLATTSSASGVATATAPTTPTGATGQVAMTVDGVANGTATITLNALMGAASSTLPVTTGSGVPTGVRVLQSAIATAEAAASVSCSMSALSTNSKLYAFAGGYLDGATGVTITDSRSPAATWTAIDGGFHTGGTSTSIGIFALSSPISSGTPSITVTATPTKSPAATNAYMSLILVEVADAGTVQANAFAIGQSATPTVDLPSITAPALVLAGTGQSGVGAPIIAPGTGFTLLQVKYANAGIGVQSKKVSATGQNDPTFSLISTVDGVASSTIEWPAVAFALNESILTAPAITTNTLAGATTGVAYSATLTATGSATITWAVTAGALPAGLSLAASTGVISGTPTTVETASFTVSATNGAGVAVKALSIAVAVPTTAPAITTASLPNGQVGVLYTQPLAATGTAPITWAITSGTLPLGLALNTSTGVISGTPTTAGTSPFTVQASNSVSTAAAVLSIAVAAAPEPPPPTPEPPPLQGQWTRVPRDAEVWIRVPRDEP
jgi:hypothetical protein